MSTEVLLLLWAGMSAWRGWYVQAWSVRVRLELPFMVAATLVYAL